MKEKIIEKVKTMLPLLNEKQKRLYLAAEAIAYGRGGITFMNHISDVSRSVIIAGVKEIKSGKPEILSADAPIRRKGAGRKPITETQPGIKEALNQRVCNATYGSPENPLCWTTKSLRTLAEELQKEGLRIGKLVIYYRKWDTVTDKSENESGRRSTL